MYLTTMLEEGGEVSGLGNYVWIAIILFFFMVFLGWLVSSKGWLKSEPDPVQTEIANESHGSTDHHPIASSSAPKKTIDDLTILEGIGPKVAGVLEEIGILSFEDLARADYSKVKTALDLAGFKYMDPAGWIEQAVLAAKGDMTGLSELQEALKGGRRAD